MMSWLLFGVLQSLALIAFIILSESILFHLKAFVKLLMNSKTKSAAILILTLSSNSLNAQTSVLKNGEKEIILLKDVKAPYTGVLVPTDSYEHYQKQELIIFELKNDVRYVEANAAYYKDNGSGHWGLFIVLAAFVTGYMASDK